ncbi:MAG TPA: cation:proton antiporter [Anaerolineaceae bacterium]
MTPFLQLALSLSIIIAAAKIGGYLSLRAGQSAVLGELLVGLLLGPSLIDLLHLSFITDQHLPDIIHEMAEIGVLLLMFLAGLELHLGELLRSGKVSALAGTLGVIIPLALGTLVGVLFRMDIQTSVFIGLILAATSVSISAQTLMELKVLRSRVGLGLLGAAVFDDILVILSLSIFLALTNPESSGGVGMILLVILKMVTFLVIASLIGRWVFPRLSKLIHNQPISQGLISFVFVTILLYGWFAEVFGQMAAITGAFLAGIWFNQTYLKDRINSSISIIAYSIFVPLFFINIGLSANIKELAGENLWLFIVLILVAIIGKIIGAGWGGNLGGLNRRESIQLGVGMMSRGEVGLIIASVGVTEGFISANIFTIIVGIVILTTILTPFCLRLLFPKMVKPETLVDQPLEGD